MIQTWIDSAWGGSAGGVARALTTTRQGGVSQGVYETLNLGDHVGDDPAAVAENRRRLGQMIGCARIQWLNQVHGTTCIHSSADRWHEVPEADAAWTTEPGLALAVLTADCVPVVLRGRGVAVVGVAHGGWRGLVSGVIGTLVEQLPVAPAELQAWLGPAIGPGAYEVGAEVADAVRQGLAGGSTDGLLRPSASPDRWLLDLFSLTERLLRQCGVEDVRSDRLCTWSDPRFFSYRRDGVTGRMATVVWLPDQASALSQLVATPR